MRAGLGWEGKTEGVGFEPTESCDSPVFKTGAINHSTTPPGWTARRSRRKPRHAPMKDGAYSRLGSPLQPPGMVCRERTPLQAAR